MIPAALVDLICGLRVTKMNFYELWLVISRVWVDVVIVEGRNLGFLGKRSYQ